MTDYLRGVVTTGVGGYGFVQSIEFNGEADEDTAKNETGVTKYHDVFDAKMNVEASIRFDRNATLPVTGAVLTLAESPQDVYNGNYKVLAPPSVTEENETGPTVRISMRRYLDGAIPAA